MVLSSPVDLKNIFDSFNALFFDNALSCSIRWGRMYSKQRRRTIRLGSFNSKIGVIRINPALASSDVPHVVLRYVVYHEMAHAWCMLYNPGMRFHNGEFKQKEREFPEFKQAHKWLKENRTHFFSLKPVRYLWTLFR